MDVQLIEVEKVRGQRSVHTCFGCGQIEKLIFFFSVGLHQPLARQIEKPLIFAEDFCPKYASLQAFSVIFPLAS